MISSFLLLYDVMGLNHCSVGESLNAFNLLISIIGIPGRGHCSFSRKFVEFKAGFGGYRLKMDS